MQTWDLSAEPDEDATNFLKQGHYTETIFTEGGQAVTVYLDLVILLNFMVDGLLLMGANRLTGHPPGWKRCALAGILGGIYAGVCMLPGFRFLGNTLWRLVSLAAMAGIAFGFHLSALRRGTIFVLLSMALGGMAIGLGQGDFKSLVLSAGGVMLLCVLGIRSPLGIDRYQPVELCWQGKTIKRTALVDTGNTLRDPITGQSVLVVDADTGVSLGISREIICDPITAMAQGNLQGARLVPYRAVGKSGGMLLMMRLEEVRLGGRTVSPMVAFAPERIGQFEGYQALAGGIV